MAEGFVIRAGDSDDYHFEDTDGVVDRLAMFGVKELDGRVKYGFTAEGFQGNGYISLYWGDANFNPIREIDADELTDINMRLDLA